MTERGAPDLPGVLAEIAEVAGRGAALAIAERLGGEQVHIPRTIGSTATGQTLDALVGHEAAAALADRFGGESLYIPMARRLMVCHLTGEGLQTAAIAARLGIAHKTVRRYRRRGQGTMVP